MVHWLRGGLCYHAVWLQNLALLLMYCGIWSKSFNLSVLICEMGLLQEFNELLEGKHWGDTWYMVRFNTNWLYFQRCECSQWYHSLVNSSTRGSSTCSLTRQHKPLQGLQASVGRRDTQEGYWPSLFYLSWGNYRQCGLWQGHVYSVGHVWVLTTLLSNPNHWLHGCVVTWDPVLRRPQAWDLMLWCELSKFLII